MEENRDSLRFFRITMSVLALYTFVRIIIKLIIVKH